MSEGIEVINCVYCNDCIHTSKAYNKAIDDATEKYFDEIEDILHDKDLKLELNQALSIYARIMNGCNKIAEQLKDGV